MSEIVKIQRPLSSNEIGNPWLIYDKDRKHTQHKPESSVPEAVKTAMDGDVKGYFMAIWSGGGWKIGDRVEEQKW
jgi:hypothetical protein